MCPFSHGVTLFLLSVCCLQTGHVHGSGDSEIQGSVNKANGKHVIQNVVSRILQPSERDIIHKIQDVTGDRQDQRQGVTSKMRNEDQRQVTIMDDQRHEISGQLDTFVRGSGDLSVSPLLKVEGGRNIHPNSIPQSDDQSLSFFRLKSANSQPVIAQSQNIPVNPESISVIFPHLSHHILKEKSRTGSDFAMRVKAKTPAGWHRKKTNSDAFIPSSERDLYSRGQSRRHLSLVSGHSPSRPKRSATPMGSREEESNPSDSLSTSDRSATLPTLVRLSRNASRRKKKNREARRQEAKARRQHKAEERATVKKTHQQEEDEENANKEKTGDRVHLAAPNQQVSSASVTPPTSPTESIIQGPSETLPFELNVTTETEDAEYNVVRASLKPYMGLDGKPLNWTAVVQFLDRQERRRMLNREAQWAYICMVGLICAMMGLTWCLGGFNRCRYRPQAAIGFSEEQHTLSVHEVLMRREKYLPMFNEPEWEDVLFSNRGTDP